MYSRPKPGETDDDLLRLQEEFTKNKNENKVKLAATVVSEKRVLEDEQGPSGVQEAPITDIQDQLANTFEYVPDNHNIGNVVENLPNVRLVSSTKFDKTLGFPKAKRRDLTVTGGSGRSIFAQQMQKLNPKDEAMEVGEVPSSSMEIIENIPGVSGFKRSRSGNTALSDSEKQQISLENIKKIKSMTQEEIVEEREKLVETMDPAIVAFLKSRRKKEEANTNRNPTIKQQNEAAQNIEIEQLETPNQVLGQASAEKWLNFDLLETNKLAWMRNVDVPKEAKSKLFEARFDFEGFLLPYSEPEMSEKTRVLYHHGEEPGRPGYTLQELFQLSRSNVIQQKVVALNSIANILSLSSTGIYDDIIDVPIEQVFFVLRFCLDDNTPSVLNAAIKAMRNLFYSKIDETCLDSLLGFGLCQVQPTLGIDNDTEDDNTVNDQQLAEKNLVKCLTRTEILTRIRYVINTVRPSVETIVYCMDLLTRLFRDSQFVMTKAYKCEGLLRTIITSFVPTTITNLGSPYGLPLLQAVKLLRVLAGRSKLIASELVNKYPVLDALLLYISSPEFGLNTNGLRLQTESFHLWSVFIHFDLGLDSFQNLYPVLMEMLSSHYKNTDVDMTTTYVRQGHVAALLNLIGLTASKQLSLVAPYITLIHQCFTKWILQFTNLSSFSCGKLQLIAVMFHCLSGLWRSKTLIPLNLLVEVEDLVAQMVNSPGFDVVTKTIKNGSMLLNNYETHKSSANFRTLEAAAWHTSEHVIPVVQTNSCIPFLSVLSQFVKCLSDNVKLAFLNHKNINNYLQDLRQSQNYYLTSNWFTRPENNLIMNILKMSVAVSKDLDTSSFYQIAVKCLSIFNADQKRDIEFLLTDIVFSSQFYPSEVLMRNLDIQTSDSLEVSLRNLGEILLVYTLVLGLKINVHNYTSNLCLDVGIGNVIPIDWIYTPIIVLYSNQQQNQRNLPETDQIYTIKNCLRWILIYETYFPELAACINPTDRFCRIACVFLGSDSLFLNDEIHNLLELCLKNVSKFQSDINFNKEIQGLTSFQDLYTQLLEQYQGVSYGDELFANFILVPLAQRHSLKWRKSLWSEYMGVVETFNLTPEKCIFPLDSFLEPPEDDISLLKCYRRALVNNSVRRQSVLYLISKHHVDEFISRRKVTK